MATPQKIRRWIHPCCQQVSAMRVPLALSADMSIKPTYPLKKQNSTSINFIAAFCCYVKRPKNWIKIVEFVIFILLTSTFTQIYATICSQKY